MKTVFDICYDEKVNQYLDLYLPEADAFSVLIYFHGGGLQRGDKSVAQRFAEDLTCAGIAVVSANYRMYPEAHDPDFVLDAASAVAWVKEHIGEYGKVDRIFIGGSSAGGYLSQMLCFHSAYLARHGLKATDFAGFLHDAGQPTVHFNILKERGVDSRRVIIDESAPLYYVGLDEAYPPMLFIVSDQDMENRYEQTMLFLSTLKHFGHTETVECKVMNGRHCAYIRAKDENGNSVFGQLVLDWIRRQFTASKAK